MSLYESHLGKRDAPMQLNEQHRDTAASSIQQIVDIAQVSGAEVDADAGSFKNYPEIPEKTQEVLTAKGITSLFPIQQKCFYHMYNREDLIARDLTGSGKTLAFALPIVEYLRKNNLFKTGKVQAIMIAPTRELALQITAEITKLKHSVEEFKVVTVYGGVSVRDQANQLKTGVDIFVGTTGRVVDHINRGNIDFAGLKTLVLDEADVMLNMGFKQDIEKVLEKVNEVREGEIQIALFSATVPSWVQDIALEFMKPDFRVVDLAQDLSNKTAKNVKHIAMECPWEDRIDALGKIITVYGGAGKIIVFTSTKNDANELMRTETIDNDIEVMHGGIAQNQREVTMKRFKNGKFQVLVATDVASRGLDIPQVDLVVQIEPPKETESYIHRAGRTARAGRSGLCISLYNSNNEEHLTKAEDLAGIEIERVEVPTQDEAEEARSKAQPIGVDYSQTKSHLTGEASKATMEMKMLEPLVLDGREGKEGKELDETSAFALIQQYWAPRVVDQVRSIRTRKDKTGVVFDLQAKSAEGFIDSYLNLKEKNGARVDFEVFLCLKLPDLEEDSGMQHEATFNAQGGYGEVKEYPDKEAKGEDGDGEEGEGGEPRPPREKKSGCFKCGEDGHFARECPNEE